MKAKYICQSEILDGLIKVWNVFETESDQVVARYSSEKDARRETKRQNRGIPWNGWTPAFFIRKNIIL